MFQFQVQIPLGTLPINLVLVGNRMKAGVVFVKVVQKFGTVFDAPEGGGVCAHISQDSIRLYSGLYEWEDFEYNTIHEYKDIPVMLKWLQQQNLQEPQNVVFG